MPSCWFARYANNWIIFNNKQTGSRPCLSNLLTQLIERKKEQRVAELSNCCLFFSIYLNISSLLLARSHQSKVATTSCWNRIKDLNQCPALGSLISCEWEVCKLQSGFHSGDDHQIQHIDWKRRRSHRKCWNWRKCFVKLGNSLSGEGQLFQYLRCTYTGETTYVHIFLEPLFIAVHTHIHHDCIIHMSMCKCWRGKAYS